MPTYVCIYVCIYVCMYIYIYIFIYIYIYIYINIYIYIYRVGSRRSRVETETRKKSGNIYRFTDGLYTKGTQAHIHRKLI